MKVATTAHIRTMNRHAKKNNYNRQLSAQAMRKLDPDGLHIVKVFIVHEHAAGVSVEAHYRCRVHLKFKDSMEPRVAWLDVTIADYDKLAEAEQLAEAEA